MTKYHIYVAIKPDGSATALAIDPSILGVHDQISKHLSLDSITKIEDFFIPGTTCINWSGEIEVSGDTHLLDGYFCVRS